MRGYDRLADRRSQALRSYTDSMLLTEPRSLGFQPVMGELSHRISRPASLEPPIRAHTGLTTRDAEGWTHGHLLAKAGSWSGNL